MRILHVFDHSIPLHSGYAFRSLAIMREQRRLGWTPLPVTGPKQHSGEMRDELVGDWHFYRTPEAQGSLARRPVLGEIALMRALTRRLSDLVRQLQPAIIHAHSPVLNGFPALRVARRFGLPMVYEVRAFWEDAAVEHGTSRAGGARYRATRAAETYVLRRADAITTICHGLRREIIARGVAADRVTVIPNAVDIEQFSNTRTADGDLRDRLGLRGYFVLGFAGSFYSYEGLELLVRALPLMRDWATPVMVLLVGGGPEDERLKTLAAELGVADSIRFTGRIPQDEVPSYYDLIDVLVYPRLRHRLTELVTPLKPLEAMAQGKLVAASDVGGHRELIRAGETGFLFAPESSEALAACVADMAATDSHRLNEIRQQARRFVERERTWRRSVARYENVYPPLLENSPGTAVSGGARL